MRTTDFRPPQVRPPLTDRQKFVTGDYVGNSYPETKFGANVPRGLLEKCVKYNQIFLFIYTLFLGTRLQVKPVGRFSRFVAQTTQTRARM